MAEYEIMQAEPALSGGGADAGTGETAELAAEGGGSADTAPESPEEAPGEGEQVSDAGRQASDKERKRAFRELVNGEYKDIYTAQTQKMIDRRFRETKQLEERLARLEPVAELLFERYGIRDGDAGRLLEAVESDGEYWARAAEKEGLTVPKYMELRRLQRENEKLSRAFREVDGQRRAREQLDRWDAEARRAREEYPELDLAREAKDPRFIAMLRSGVPVEHAYRVMHLDELMSGAAAEAERRVVDSIRARGARPGENGTASQSAFTVRGDVSQLTRQDRREIARAVARGERISF